LFADCVAKKTKVLPLLFVDTNILLNFYRARGEAGLTLLERLETVAESLILTDQIEVEFVNNRQNVIAETLKGINAPTIPVPAYLVASRVATSIEKHQTKIRAQIKVLTEKVNRLVKDPAKHDPVLRTVKKLMAKNSPLNLKWAKRETHELICKRALLRYQRHFPPRKKNDHGIGDAINWEWVLHCASSSNRGVIVATEDSDFGDKVLLDCLSEEFALQTNHKAELVSKLSEALKRLDVKVTEAEEKEEQSIIQTNLSNEPIPKFWPDMLERIKVLNEFIHHHLKEATGVKFDNGLGLLMLEFPWPMGIVASVTAPSETVLAICQTCGAQLGLKIETIACSYTGHPKPKAISTAPDVPPTVLKL
jgi:hypothetical protein